MEPFVERRGSRATHSGSFRCAQFSGQLRRNCPKAHSETLEVSLYERTIVCSSPSHSLELSRLLTKVLDNAGLSDPLP